jgi:hypothetical protein
MRTLFATRPVDETELAARRWSVGVGGWATLAGRVLGYALPLALLLFISYASFAALTHRRFERDTGVTDELVKGRTAGQSFVAEYSNLSGVEVRIGTYGRGHDPSRPPLVMHLRTAPGMNWRGTSQEGVDLRTASLSPDTPLDENAWYQFTFAPVPDSKGKSFYVEVETPTGRAGRSLSVYWWQPTTEGDPYPGGSAYWNGQQQKGDLTFGLSYSPPPVEVLGDLGGRIARSGSGGGLSLVLLAGLALVVVSVFWVSRKGISWLVRRSLPIVLAVSLANGLLYALLIPPWQGPDEHSHFAYAVLLDRYGMDVAQLQSQQLGEQRHDLALERAVTASMDRYDFTRLQAVHSAPGATSNAGYSLYWELSQPPAYYWLGVMALRTARALGVNVDPYGDPEGVLRLLRGVSVLLATVVAGLAWMAGKLLGGYERNEFAQRRRGRGWLKLVLPLTVSLLPMHAFSTSVANNDIMAELLVSTLFVVLVALLRYPTSLRGAALALAAIALAIASPFTKASAMAAAMPLASIGLAAWAGLLVWRAVRRQLSDQNRRTGWVPATVALLVVILTAAVFVSLYEPSGTAVGWHASATTFDAVPRVAAAGAHKGSYVIELRPTGGGAVAYQTLVPKIPHPAFDVAFAGWARAVGPSPNSAAATLAVQQGGKRLGLGVAQLPSTGEWTQLTVQGRVFESSDAVTLQLGAWQGDVQFDDFSLETRNFSAPWPDPVFSLNLLNPSGEQEAFRLRPIVAKLVPSDVTGMADALVNPQQFSRLKLWRYYANMEFQSFWGNFGWLSIPLPGAVYTMIGLLMVLALSGLIWQGLHRLGRWSATEWTTIVAIAALAATISLTYLRQTMTVIVDGTTPYLQGRYLFVLSIGIAWLILAGMSAAGAGVWRFGVAIIWVWQRTPAKELLPEAASRSPRPGLGWAIWLWSNMLATFAAYCLLVLIIPYYYG